MKPTKNMRNRDLLFHRFDPHVKEFRTCPPARFVFFVMGTAAILTSLLGGSLLAHPVESASAERVALTKLAELDADGQYDLAGIKELVSDEADRTLAYVFDLWPQGFIIVSGNKSLPPVVAYSLDNALKPASEQENPLLVLVRSDLGKRLANSDRIQIPWLEKNRETWDRYLSGDARAASDREFWQWPPSGTTPTGGWLNTRWSQDPPYNSFCPVDPTTGNRSLAGCPAVAMAQIFNYHSSLNGTRFDDEDDYYHNYAGQYWIDDDHDDHDFPSFPELNVYLDALAAHYQDGASITNDDKAAVVFACGVAAHQVYSSQCSGTSGVNQAYQAYLRFAFNEVELLGESASLLYHRLSLNMIDALPAHLAVVTPQWDAGHNLVADGYNTDGYYHMNFGWGGYADAWYDLPEELPYNLTVIEGLIVDIASASIYPDGNDEPLTATMLELPVQNESPTIYPEGDIDWFCFYSEGVADLRMFSEKIEGCELDPMFWLYGPHAEDGSDVEPDSFIVSDDNSHGDMQPEIGFTTEEPGYYFLRVARSDSVIGGESTGAYLLNIEVIGGLAPPGSLFAQVNENDVHLAWRPPQGVSRDLIGYHVYRDAERLNTETVLTTEYDDLGLQDGTYVYYVTAVYQGGESESSNLVTAEVSVVAMDENPMVPVTTSLRGSHPNPSRGAMEVRYSLSREGAVTVTVYDLAGRKVRTLVQGKAGKGAHSVVWDGTDMNGRSVAAGLYFCRMSTADFAEQQALIVLR